MASDLATEISAVARRVRSEADIASRAGQCDRLMALAERLDVIAQIAHLRTSPTSVDHISVTAVICEAEVDPDSATLAALDIAKHLLLRFNITRKDTL